MRISSSTRPIGGLVRFACLPLPSKKKQISPVAKPLIEGLATFFIELKSSKEIYFPVVTVDQQNLRERYSARWSSCPLELKRMIGGRVTTARDGRSKLARFVTCPVSCF